MYGTICRPSSETSETGESTLAQHLKKELHEILKGTEWKAKKFIDSHDKKMYAAIIKKE